ncbi:hypothetical protein [Tessaracoccus antarcticus]|uniref:hypothetical protein n=1 Tax=Tessaracoccus antarcticus TaxID=2479848 RepID=UPI0011C34B45|nr:hypothetical protein [Tessaracoccus antarcticus]
MKRTGAVFVALLLTLTLVAPSTAHADATDDASVTNASTWIADTWKTKRNQFFAAGTTADGVIALSAANKEPDTVRSMLLDLKGRGPAYAADNPAGLAKMILTADVAGQNPRTLFGCQRDLVAELKAMVTDGPVSSGEYWGPYLIAIALTRAEEQVPDWVIDYMQAHQEGGGFGYREGNKFVADPDYTAVGISAMQLVATNDKVSATHRSAAAQSVSDAVDWSQNVLNRRSDAAGNYYWTTYSPANSTGMLASALREAGEDITSPVKFLKAQQTLTKAGGWGSELNDTKPNVMATTQAVLGIIGKGYGTAHSTQVGDLANCTNGGKPAFQTQPQSLSVDSGSSATFTAYAAGDPSPAITWQKDVKGTWTAISGANTPTLILDKVGADVNGLRVRAVASNTAGSATSSVATLAVKPVAQPSPSPSPTVKPTPPKTVYNTPGDRTVNGRNWRTTCEPYSKTTRCRTLIEATTVSQVNGRFVTSKGYVFNNLTYLPSPRSLWKTNPLGGNGKPKADVTWTAADGRTWRTECDTATTGRNGCRTYATARVIDIISRPGQPTTYRWVTKEIFNNMVQFS